MSAPVISMVARVALVTLCVYAIMYIRRWS
jgi:hypothetical protein